MFWGIFNTNLLTLTSNIHLLKKRIFLKHTRVEICLSIEDEDSRESFYSDMWALQYYDGLMKCQEKLGDMLARKKANSTRGNLQKAIDNKNSNEVGSSKR